MASYIDFDAPVDLQGFDYREYLYSLPEKERRRIIADRQRVGLEKPTDDGFFGEFADRSAGSFVGILEGVGATANELGLGSGMQDYFGDVLNRNQQWNPAENTGITGYIGGAIGDALGSTAGTLTAGAAGSLVNPGVGLAGGLAMGFAQSFGNNVQRNRKAGYSEEKALGMAFLESAVDTAIENAPWGIVGKGTKLAANLGRLHKISSAGKKELLNKIGKKLAAEVGQENSQNLLWKWAKQSAESGLGEAGEEGLQYLNSYVNQKLGGDPNAEFSLDDFVDSIAKGFIGGFAIGGVQNSPGIIHDAIMRKLDNASTDSATVQPEAVSSETVQNASNMPEAQGEVNGGENISSVSTPTENALFDTLITDVGNALGINIDFMDSRPDGAELEKENNGIYDKNNKTLYLNRNTYSVNPAETLGHELKHYIDENIPELSKAFNTLLEAGKTEAGKQEVSEIAREFGITEAEGNVEFSADMFGKLFARPETWQKMAAQLDERTPGMGEKFLQTLRDFYSLVKTKLSGLVGTNPEAETFLNNVTELENEAARMLAELRRRNGNSTQVENVVGAKGNTNVETVPVSQINVDAKRFQFKSNTSKLSGVDESNKLGGDWDPRTAGNLYLWEDKDGKLYVVNGHHRLELAQRNGVENINAIIDRESDGVTAEQARRNGVLINIRDGQGEVRDYASFVRSEKLSEDEAKAQGVTARQKGRAGYLLGKSGDTLYEAYINEVIPESKAVVIAEVAQGNEAIEYAGIKLANDRKLAGETLRQTLKLAAQNTSETKSDMEQDSLFDMVDDSVLQEWEAIGKAAAKHIKEIRTRIEAAKDAIKNPEAAKSLGVKTTKGAEKLLSQAQQELARWENYATDAGLMAQLRAEAGINVESGKLKVEGTENAQPAETAVVKDNLTTETAATAEESSEVEETPEVLAEKQDVTVGERNVPMQPEEEIVDSESEVVSAEKEQTTNEEDEKLEKIYTGIDNKAFEDFYKKSQDQKEKIIAGFRKTYKHGSILEDKWQDAADAAIVKAFKAYDPEKAQIETFVSTYIKNAIIDVNRKLSNKSNIETVSLDQENEQGHRLEDVLGEEIAVEDKHDIDEKDFKARYNKWKRKLDKKDRDILSMNEKGFSPSVIARKIGEGTTTDYVELRIQELFNIAKENVLQYQRKRLHQQINPIVRDGKVRDEYADLLTEEGYTPESIKQWQEQALEWIIRVGGIVPAAEKMLENQSPSNPAVAEIARRLIMNSDVFMNDVSRSDRVKFIKMEINTRSNWGRAGRAMQINALNLKDVASVQALFDKLHENMPEADVRKLRDQIKDDVGIDIYELSDDIVKDKSKLDAVLRAHLAKKASFGDKVYEYWINAILSGPWTHFGNFIGNIANAFYELGIKRFAEALVNTVSGRKSGATFREFREMLRAFNWGNALKELKNAYDIEVLDPDGKFLENNKTAIGGKTGRIIRTPGRVLKAADAFAKALIQPMETAAYAYRKGVEAGLSGEKLSKYIESQLKDKDSKSNEWGRERSKELTFQEDPGGMVKRLIALKEAGGISGTAFKYFLPFVKTPFNILRQGARKSPLGSAQLAIESIQKISDRIKTGKWNIDDKYISHVAEQLIAWSVVMALYGLSDDDDLPIITGSPAKYGSAENKFKADKIPPYSIRFGNTWISYAKIEPLATSLSAIADGLKAFRDVKNGKDGTAVMKQLLQSGAKLASEKSYLSAIGELVNIFEDDSGSLAQVVTSKASSFVPNMYYQVRNAFVEKAPDYKSREKGVEFLKDQFFVITGKLGFTTMLPKVDHFGRDVMKDNLGDNFLSVLGRVATVKSYDAEVDKADQLILNYNHKNPDSQYYPMIPSNTFTVYGKKMYLSGEAYRDYAMESGKLALKQIHNGIRGGYLDVNNPDEQDIKLIKSIFARARKEMRKKYLKRAKNM